MQNARSPGFARGVRLGLVLICFCCGPLHGQIVPGVKVDIPAEALIGETFTFRIEVSPDLFTTGYGPFLEICLPYQGADCTNGPERCDGISFVKAEAVFAGTRVLLSPCPAGGPPFVLGTTCAAPNPQQCPGTISAPPPSCFFGVDPPVCPLQNPAGCQKVVLELPIGSFVPGQAPIVIEIMAKVDSYADLGFPLFVGVRSGFRFGTSAQGAAPTVDPACPMAGGPVSPTLATIQKSYLGPEGETATGPNFERKYKLTVDIANGQTLDPLRIVDCLPDNITLVGGAPPAGCTASLNPPECPGAGFEVECPSVTGTALANDLEVEFSFFVPEKDLSGQPVLGSSCSAVSIDDVKLFGEWAPLDPRDPPPVPFTSDVTDEDHTLKDLCLAIQKKAEIVIDLGAPGPTPGDTLRYTLDFQVSDFKTLRNLVVEDVLSDGQSFIPGSAQLQIGDKFGSVSGSFAPGDILSLPFIGTWECEGGSKMENPVHFVFNVNQRLIALDPGHPRHSKGILTGGLAGLPAGGPATGRITFDARIDDVFQWQDSSLELFVDKDDVLLDCAEIRAETLANVNAPAVPATVAGPASDDSEAQLAIVHGTVRKTVYAINGSTSFPKPVKLNPGDDVTFRIEYTIPSGDAEDFYFEDYLPLPVFRSDKLKYLACLAPPPPAETVTVAGPLCSEPVAFSVVPSGSKPGNSFKLSFGDLEDPANLPVKADVYVTTRVTTEPFVDGLLLSNHVLQHEQNTFGESFDQTEIAQVTVGEPSLRIRKGVVSSSKATAAFSPGPPVPGGVTFKKPGTAGPAFTGALTSSNVGTALNSNVSQVDGCDFVKFAIVIENTGSSAKGAFDVRISDLLPSCLKSPNNFRVVNGNGKPFTCNQGKNCGALLTQFRGAGITLDDGSTGALAPYSPAGGDNIAVITFDAQVPCNAQPTGCCNNVAKILSYAGVEGGPSHTKANFSAPFPDLAKAFEDDAQVCVRPNLKKSILATSEPSTAKAGAAEPLAIGEVVHYCLQAGLPEGSSPQMVINDQLPPGLEWLPGTCTMGVQHKSAACTIGPKDPKIVLGVKNPQAILQGGSLTVNLGTVKNNHNDAAEEVFVVICNALVLNVPVNAAPVAKPNSFTVTLTPPGGQPVTVQSNTVQAVIAEPTKELKKEEVPVCLPGGARYRLSYTNSGTATAFEVRLRDLLPSGLTVSGLAPSLDIPGCTFASSGPSFVDMTCPSVAPGQTLFLLVDVLGFQTCQTFENQARLDLSSLPGPQGTVSNPTGSQTPGASGAANGERVDSSGTVKLASQHCSDLKIEQILTNFTPGLPMGSVITYSILVTNLGLSPSFPSTFVESKLPIADFQAGGGNGWFCTSNGAGIANCTLDDPIPPGATSTFTIEFVVTQPPAGAFVGSAMVTGCEDTDPSNNSCTGLLGMCGQ